MTYELAKRLEDEGFPLIDRIGYAYNGEGKLTSFLCDTNDFPKDWVYIPTLSELIEACGERFWELARDGGTYEWLAYDNEQRHISGGPTPETAVANLWLKLHSKN